MSYITFHDISYAQGAYNMAADPNPVIALKMSGFYYGAKTGYLDTQAAHNYNNAVKAGKVPILYHFAGGADPVAEAEYFVAACSPLAEGDIYALDYELTETMNPPSDPVGWCAAFVNRVHEKTGVWPLFYTYAALLAAHDWSPVLQNCGLWIADYAVTPEGTVPTEGHPYIIHQYTSTPIDTNALFIPLETLKKYGYHPMAAPQPTPAPAPAPAPAPVPPVVVTGTTTAVPTLPPVSPAAPPSVAPSPQPVPEPAPTPKPAQTLPRKPTAASFWVELFRLIMRHLPWAKKN